ncbi:MAG TPA: NADH-quinone oxidoreductase subunit M [Bacteroidales bacterium]|nr:NADH-quinone oxidoreductase subunit M [Bacteroidales bacterium]
MILLWFILVLIVAGVAAWLAARWSESAPGIIAVTSIIIDTVLLLFPLFSSTGSGSGSPVIEYNAHWIPEFGVSLHFMMDGLSLLMLILTLFLGLISVIISWKEVKERTGFFHFNLMWILAGISGVFLSRDLFLFYFFWEMMLVPMYFLIGIWGHENKIYASYKFFIYTQSGGLLMFLAILTLYFINAGQTGVYSFDYDHLLGTVMPLSAGFVIMAGFLAAFLIKLPVVPFHNWLPDAHTEAPTAGSVILAGLMLKTGAYGLIRFVLPFFPEQSVLFAPFGMALGVTGILYGAKLAFAQTDFKRLVAYTSVSHMGFIMLGVYSFNMLALQGVVVQIIAHAISTGALFILVGQLQERIHTRDLNKMGGLWSQVPVMGSMGLVFSLASLGLPGFGNFVAEFLTLLGAFKANVLMSVLASLGLIASMVYSLRIMQKVFYGKETVKWNIPDFNLREKLIYGVLIASIFYLGLFPGKILDTSESSIDIILKSMTHNKAEAAITGSTTDALIPGK